MELQMKCFFWLDKWGPVEENKWEKEEHLLYTKLIGFFINHFTTIRNLLSVIASAASELFRVHKKRVIFLIIENKLQFSNLQWNLVWMGEEPGILNIVEIIALVLNSGNTYAQQMINWIAGFYLNYRLLVPERN